MWGERSIPKLIVVTPMISIALLVLIITYFYVDKMQNDLQRESRLLKERLITDKKNNMEAWGESVVRHLALNEAHIEENVKTELKERITLAHDTAQFLHKKYSGKMSFVEVINVLPE